MKITYTLLSPVINQCSALITDFGIIDDLYNNNTITTSCSHSDKVLTITFTAVSTFFDYNVTKNPQWRQDYQFTF
jgi:hypothetical protein